MTKNVLHLTAQKYFRSFFYRATTPLGYHNVKIVGDLQCQFPAYICDVAKTLDDLLLLDDPRLYQVCEPVLPEELPW